MKVSVVMAVGPDRSHYREATQSLKSQTMQDFELIIETMPGLAQARNEGFRAAKAEYVAVMDSDDVSYPTRFEREVEYLDDHPDVSVVGSWGDRIGLREGLCSPPEKVGLMALFLWDRVIHTSAMMRKKDVLPFGPYQPVLFEDWDLWIRLAKAGKKLRNIQEPLVAFRFTEDGHSARVPRAVWYMEQLKQRLGVLV